MILPKKKSLEMFNTEQDNVDEDFMVVAYEKEDKLDSSAQKQLADEWEEQMRRINSASTKAEVTDALREMNYLGINAISLTYRWLNANSFRLKPKSSTQSVVLCEPHLGISERR